LGSQKVEDQRVWDTVFLNNEAFPAVEYWSFY